MPLSLVIGDIPVSSLVAVDVAAGSLPLRVSITTVSNLREGAVDVVVQGRLVLDVDLVPVSMGVGAACMADFSTACDDEGTDSRGFLEGDNTINGTREDALVGRAS